MPNNGIENNRKKPLHLRPGVKKHMYQNPASD
jgi:hypothetical protein